MYNVLACDDEQIAIDSIKFIFEKNFQGQVNLKTALSGFEALNIVRENDIDIIFMDINMPGMNGLETIRLISQVKPEIIIIVLSAFDTFQYAQEALNLGAFRYITKPVNRNTIIQTVRSAMNQVDNLKGNAISSEEIQKKLDAVSPMIESDFFYSCAFCSESDDLSPYLEYFSIADKNYIFAALEFSENIQENKKEYSNLLRQIVNEHQKCITGSFMSNRFILLIAFDKESFFPEKVHETLRSIHTIITIKMDRKVRIGVSSICSREIQFKDCYNQAVTALNKTTESQTLILFEDIVTSLDKTENTKNILERYYKRLKNGDIEGAQYLSRVFLKSLGESELSSDSWKFSLIEFLINTKSAVISVMPSFDTSLFEPAFSIVSKASSIDETSAFIDQRVSESVQAINHSRKNTENPVIAKVKAYINMHLSSDFSLEDAALNAGVTSFYLSKLFREETNETFVNYVTELKMEKAARLLRESDMSIKEISAATGYNDQNYFSKIFKNKFELSPSEYRKQNEQKN